MAAKLLISLLGTIMFWTIYGYPMPENEPNIPLISIPAESLKEDHAKTNTSNGVLTEGLEKSINDEQSQEKSLLEQVNENASTEQLNEKVSNKNSNKTQAQANANPREPAVMIQTNDQPSEANKHDDVITTPQQVKLQTPSRQENSPKTQLSQEIPSLQPMPELQQQQPNQLHIVIPAPSNQSPNYLSFQPLYFNSSQRPSQPLQPQFIFNQPPPMLPMLSFPSQTMFPLPQFPPPAFITVQPGTGGIPRPLQPNQQLGGMAQPNQLPIFYMPSNTPNDYLRPPFPMMFSPPAPPQLPQFVLYNQQTSPSDTVIEQSSVYLGQPNQSQEFILIGTK